MLLPAVSAVEDVARTLLAPLCSPEGGSIDLISWLGLSSWLVSGALALEAARRCLRRQAARRLVSPLGPWNLPPETDV